MLPRTGSNAVEFAESINSWPREGLCLNFVRTCLRVDAMKNASPPGGTARLAWDRSPSKHTSRHNIPLGAPVFFFGLGWAEHITIYTGSDDVRTTDYPYARRVTTVDIDTLEARWACYYKGWSEHLNGVRVVPLSALPSYDYVHLGNLRRGIKHQDVRQFKRACHKALGTNPSGDDSSFYGQHAVDLCKKVYKKWGWTGGDLGTPGPRMLQRLGLHYKP